MEIYSVGIWDTNWNLEDPEGWQMESPQVKVRAIDSYEAALKVARRENPSIRLEGIQRPEGWTGMLFQDRSMGLVFHVEALGKAVLLCEDPYRGMETETWKMRTRRPRPVGEYGGPYESGEKDIRVRRLRPNVWEEV